MKKLASFQMTEDTPTFVGIGRVAAEPEPVLHGAEPTLEGPTLNGEALPTDGRLTFENHTLSPEDQKAYNTAKTTGGPFCATADPALRMTCGFWVRTGKYPFRINSELVWWYNEDTKVFRITPNTPSPLFDWIKKGCEVGALFDSRVKSACDAVSAATGSTPAPPPVTDPPTEAADLAPRELPSGSITAQTSDGYFRIAVPMAPAGGMDPKGAARTVTASRFNPADFSQIITAARALRGNDATHVEVDGSVAPPSGPVLVTEHEFEKAVGLKWYRSRIKWYRDWRKLVLIGGAVAVVGTGTVIAVHKLRKR